MEETGLRILCSIWKAIFKDKLFITEEIIRLITFNKKLP